ncbi:MAG: hypothetical protein K9M94_13735 [Spirochaetia bacterium]|nr:hypothetical protein [Spirochaetia bacterium]
MRLNSKAIALIQNILPQSLLLLLLVLPVLLSSCSGAPPQIAQLFWQLNIVRDIKDSTQHEELSLYVHAQDPDGTGDLEEIELVHPEAELRWNFTAENWHEVVRNDEMWLGGNGIKSGFTEEVPRGEYRVKVLDRAGETAVTSFFISKDIQGLQKGNIKESRFPRLQVMPDSIKLYFSAPEVLLSLYDGDEQFLRSQAFTSSAESDGDGGQVPTISDWRSKWPGAEMMWIQEYDSARGFGLVSGPYLLPQSE